MRRVTGRLVPLLFVVYIVAYIDRVNVGFAQLTMGAALGLSAGVYAFGAGIFFIGYFLFEIPSNLILQRVGARRWIARIIFSWGLVSMAMALTRSPAMFCTLRFLLGVAEAGFFPGIILYLTWWYRAEERARLVALFMTASTLAGVVGSPVSGILLHVHRWMGMAGWQLLFLGEGAPALLLDAFVLRWLPDGPETAPWLSDPERQRVKERLKGDDRAIDCSLRQSVAALRMPVVWLLTCVYFTVTLAGYGVQLWLPIIIKAAGHLSNLATGCTTALPYLAATAAMLIMGFHSDRTGERSCHIFFSAAAGAIGLAGAFCYPAYGLLWLCLALAGTNGIMGPFWALATARMVRETRAAGVAAINCIGNLGGFFGPQVVGALGGAAGGRGLLALAAALFFGGALALTVKYDYGSLNR
ncbi:MAG: MFS transporter [Armatimonadetes bacterium]|nr:MFS transporter [Armatimonadota bacterium]MDE2208050.1 MFS transporter [Armatimonadota bacterium]